MIPVDAVAGLLEGAELREDRRDAEAAADEDDVADLARRAAACPSGPTKSSNVSPSWYAVIISRVVLPSAWMTIVTVPQSRSKSATVSGMRSPPSCRRTMTKWPGCAARATSGAYTSQRNVDSENW